MILDNGFDTGKQCCFCGENNEDAPVGYAGERCCGACGWGGQGERDNQEMAYKNWPTRIGRRRNWREAARLPSPRR